jgi:hypothetical protein
VHEPNREDDMPSETGSTYPISVVIPAHNEEVAIRRLLSALSSAHPEVEILVICNGCQDRTATVARSVSPRSTVHELEQPSKMKALRFGDQVAHHFPRVYVDADVTISGSSLQSLADALTGSVLASGPMRAIDTSNSSSFVRWYYEVWEQLPQVRNGLFGRGVIAVSRQGFERLQSTAETMSDDLAFSEAFAEGERAVMPSAVAHIKAPATLSGLIKRRVRVVTGNAQFDNQVGRHKNSVTSTTDLTGLLKRQPSLAPKMLVFLGVTIVARWKARRFISQGDFTTWHRDDSSRT